MFKKSFVVVALLACFAGTAAADIVCPDSSYVTVQYATAKDRVTISPNGNGETFASNGITIKVYLENCSGAPLAGIPAQEIVISNAALCICPGGNIADAATDLNGATSFSGTIHGGGCAPSLTVFADGTGITQKVVAGLMPPASLTPPKTNSQDVLPSSPCFVDAGDLPALAQRLGCPSNCPPMSPGYTICVDWNEDGAIDAGDAAGFAFPLGAACR